MLFSVTGGREYKFSWMNVDSMGSAGDANIFNHSELRGCIKDDTIGFPAAEPLPQDDQVMPYFIVGDDAFALRTLMMIPDFSPYLYSKRHLTDPEWIFNYQLSRARRIVENAFGILAHRSSACGQPWSREQNCGIYCAGLRVPPQYDTPDSKTWKFTAKMRTITLFLEPGGTTSCDSCLFMDNFAKAERPRYPRSKETIWRPITGHQWDPCHGKWTKSEINLCYSLLFCLLLLKIVHIMFVNECEWM